MVPAVVVSVPPQAKGNEKTIRLMKLEHVWFIKFLHTGIHLFSP